MAELPTPHARLVQFVAVYRHLHHRSPTQAEIAEHLGCTRQRVQQYVAALQDRGVLTRRWCGQRSVQLAAEVSGG